MELIGESSEIWQKLVCDSEGAACWVNRNIWGSHILAFDKSRKGCLVIVDFTRIFPPEIR